MNYQSSKSLYKKNYKLSTLAVSISLITSVAIPATAATITTNGAVILSNPVTTPMWNAGSDTYLGSGGVGTLTASQGAVITGMNFYVGQNSGDMGTLNLSDSDTTLTSGGLTSIGESGNGTLNIFNSAILTNNWNKSNPGDPLSYSFNIGKSAGSQGIVNVSGTGTALNVTGTSDYSGMSVGLYGSGLLNISQGGIVSSPRVRVGVFSAADGTVIVDGAGSKLSVINPNQWLIIGVNGTGNLTVSNQGQVDVAGYLRIAEGTNGGPSGTGNVQILSGGKLNVNNFTDIAFFHNTNGQLRVSDTGSTFTSSGRIIVGRQGKGSLTVSNYGTIRSDRGIIVGSNILGTGNVNIGEGEIAGVLDVPTVTGGPGSANINFNHTDDINFAPQMLGTLNLNKSGSGTTTLMANNTYSGQTTVNQGNLQAGAENVFSPNSFHMVESGGQLDLNGFNQKIASLTNSGIVKIAGSSAGTILNVIGDYVGNNGRLIFNTVLGDDTSVTDKLVIDRNASGTTYVTVNNAGGTGAKTIDGIELIHIGGTSTESAFSQSGRIVAGAYDYTLVKGNTSATDKQSWFLTNKLTPQPEPQPEPQPKPQPEPQPEPQPKPQPVLVYRPESASYTSNLMAANTLFYTRLHDRLGETQYTDALSGERKITSMWMRNVAGRKLFNMADGQNKTAANRYILQIGGDLAQWSGNEDQRFHLGLMGGYASQHSNTNNTLSGNSSKGSISGYSAGLYGTYYQNQKDKSGLYIDSWLQYNWFDNTVNGEGQAEEKYKSRGLTASLETGYSFLAGTYETAYGMKNTFYIQPKAQATWMGVKAKEHRENNGTLVQSVGDNNVQTRLGVRLFLNGKSHLDKETVREFEPFIEANWIYNTKQFGARLNGVETASYGTRNVGELKAGVEGKISDNLNVWGNVAQQIGGKGYSDSQAMLGIKYMF